MVDHVSNMTSQCLRGQCLCGRAAGDMVEQRQRRSNNVAYRGSLVREDC